MGREISVRQKWREKYDSIIRPVAMYLSESEGGGGAAADFSPIIYDTIARAGICRLLEHQLQGVSQITLQTQNAISPEIMLIFPQKFHCIIVRSYLTTY